MRVRPRLMPRATRPAIVTDARSAAALLFVAILLASGLPLPGRGADAGSPPPPPAAPLFPSELGPGVLLTHIYPNAARDDEFVELANFGPAAVDLSGWSLTDREAAATFPPGTVLAPSTRIVATRNATSYAEDVRRPADFTYDQGDAPRMGGEVLRLADGGDEVLLADAAGATVDAYVYGASAYAGSGWSGPPAAAPGKGEVAARTASEDGELDHDAAGDWDGVRAYRLGQSAFDPPALEIAAVPAVVLSPEDGRGPLLSFLASADRTLEVAVYTLTSEAIDAVLVDRARSGVRVRVLLEGAPVGGIDEDERHVVSDLLAAGAQVRCLSSVADAVKRYRYLHAKYAIVDGEAIVVSSENFGDSGFPASGEPGNRGWSVIVEDRALAGQLWEVFEEDFDPSRADSVPATGVERGKDSRLGADPPLAARGPLGRTHPPPGRGTGRRPLDRRLAAGHRIRPGPCLGRSLLRGRSLGRPTERPARDGLRRSEPRREGPHPPRWQQLVVRGGGHRERGARVAPERPGDAGGCGPGGTGPDPGRLDRTGPQQGDRCRRSRSARVEPELGARLRHGEPRNRAPARGPRGRRPVRGRVPHGLGGPPARPWGGPYDRRPRGRRGDLRVRRGGVSPLAAENETDGQRSKAPGWDDSTWPPPSSSPPPIWRSSGTVP